MAAPRLRIWGFFYERYTLRNLRITRTTYLIDGFNLYHSVREASYDAGLQGKGTKWLDLRTLCEFYLYLIGDFTDSYAELEDIYYFSAYATHLISRNPGVVKRHQKFVRGLADFGIHVEMAKFKEKQFFCSQCGHGHTLYEEKETEVAISIKIFELLSRDLCDAIVLVSGDTDIAPAVRTAKRLFPDKYICFAFPYKRKNRELEQLAHYSFKISRSQYQRFQFPNPLVLQDGTKIEKPASW